MKITDLTYLVQAGMPVFPGTEPPKFEKVMTLETGFSRETLITMYSHTGTHMDAPAHMMPNGKYLDELPVSAYVGKATLLDFKGLNVPCFDVDLLKKYEERIKNVEILVIDAGWGKYWGTDQFYYGWPALTVEAAEWLVQFNLKGICADVMSVDDSETENDCFAGKITKDESYPVHKIFFDKGMYIVENMTNLDAIKSEYFTIALLPLNFKEADGSAVRAIAVED